MRRVVPIALCLVALPVVAFAGSIGIPLDSFLTQLLTWIIGLGLLLGMSGAVAWVYQQFSNPFAPLLTGVVGLIITAGFFAGAPTIFAQVGLVSGALL